jgi:tetratricopeptide (TPR) repeat protein
MKPITTAAMILLLAMAAGADDKKAAMLIQAAEAKETIQGDLKAAIELYGQAAKEAGPNRSLAAKSLLRMAECYQKTGNAEARKIYEQVVREYGDQKEAVAEARARLGGPDRAAAETGVASRQRWTMPSGGQIFGLISADGRYLPYTNWRDKADLFLHDMSSGSNRRITDDGDGGNLFAGEAVLSRDDSQIAFSFYGSDHFEIRLASLEGTGVPKAKVIYTNPD